MLMAVVESLPFGWQIAAEERKSFEVNKRCERVVLLHSEKSVGSFLLLRDMIFPSIALIFMQNRAKHF